jgi:hypothetical protein
LSPPAENNPEIETGFRDALILETLREICRMNPSECIVFVTSDRLLRQAAEGLRLTGEVSFYDDIMEFWSNLKLLQENRSKEFRATLLTNAPKAFYDKENPNCVYNKFGIPKAIIERFDQTINHPQDPILPLASIPQLGGPLQQGLSQPNPWATSSPVFDIREALEALTRKWKPATEERFHIGETNFQDLRNGRTVWRTRIEAVRAFGHDGPASALSFLGVGIDDRVRIAQVDVIWDALVSEDAELSDWELKDIKLAATIFEPLSIEHRLKYNFTSYSRYVPLPETSDPQRTRPDD